MHIEGFGGRGGFGRRPALVVIDMPLVVTGASTSGCVRATAVDALQYGSVPWSPARP